jgi:hypothetical protein
MLPETAAPEQPTVLEVEIVGNRTLASVEKGDVSLLVEAPAGISAEELEQTLSGVPESIERTTERFAATTTMSDDTTETDGSTDAEGAADDKVRGGV